LQYLITLHDGDAFAFYDRLTSYWEQQELHVVAHSSKSLYKYILDFSQLYHKDDMRTIQEVLKFDALLSEKGTLRPDVLSWNKEVWAKEKGAFWSDHPQVREYLPQYAFTTWRDINKKYHIEVFSMDIPEYLLSGNIVYGECPILFCYGSDQSTYKKLDRHDFWQAGGRD